MEDIRTLVNEVLETGLVMSLATVDEGGVWVSDQHYVNDDDLNIFWKSGTDSRHSKAILKNAKVAATITLSNLKGQENHGVQIEGTAEKIDGDVFSMAVKIRLKEGKQPPTKAGEALKPGDSWYKLKPTKIELIHAKLFGFEKKVLLLNEAR